MERKDGLYLDAIEARANAATPGPWRWDPEREPDEPGRLPYVPQGAHLGTTLIGMDDTYEGSDADAAFIAAARTDVPALVARVRELEARVSLPVIATCGECGSREDHLHETLCDHPESPHRWRVSMYRGTGTPPPSWCPLRGGAR